MVYKNHHKANAITTTTVSSTKKLSSTNTQNKVTSTADTDPYAGWLSYTSKLEKISVKYPSGWTVETNGALFGILNNSAQEENFIVQSPVETLSDGKAIFGQVSLAVATSGLSAGDCNGLIVHYINDVTVSGRTLEVVALDSYTQPGDIIGIYVTDEQGLKVGSRTTTCQPSFASVNGNSNVFINATFSTPPTPTTHADGSSTELTEAEYNQSSIVRSEIKSLESLSY